MNNINRKKLPITCICSIYVGTILEEFIIAIDSLLIQEYIPSEIIVIVDGQINNEIKDFIVNILKLDNIFKIYFIDQNQGLGFALKYGLSKSSHEIIARFDSDDINLENRLKVQYDLLIAKPEISIIGSDVLEFNNSDHEVFIKRMNNNEKLLSGFMIRNQLNHPSVMYRKKDIINAGSYKDIKFFEDYELWLRCIKEGFCIHNINKALVAMRRTSYLANRIGISYAIFELRFLKEAIKQNTIMKMYIPLFLIKIIIRLLPKRFFFIIRLFDSSRLLYKEDFNLDDYIFKVINSKDSIYKKYKKLICK